MFRFNPQVYADFKEAVSKKGYAAADATEKFRADAIQYGLTFP